MVGTITLYLYVARFLIGKVHSDLNCEEDKSAFRSKLRGRQTSVNELNQSNRDSGATLTSISRTLNMDMCQIQCQSKY